MTSETDLYPTRGERERIFKRTDPVVFGSAETASRHGLTQEQLAAYERDGFLLLSNYFPPEEVKVFLREFEQMGRKSELQDREEMILEPDSDTPRSVFNPHRFSELFERLSRDRRILDKVTQLLGGPAYIHHGRVNIKPAFHGKSFPWHSDFETWHAEDGLPRCRVLTAWLMLTGNNEFNGPLYLVPGSHRWFVSCAGRTPQDHHQVSLRRQEYGVPSSEIMRRLVAEGGIAGAYGPAGTLVFHEGNTMHGSPTNISPWPRTNLMWVYNSVENTPLDKPFGAEKPRPEFLRNTDWTPLQPIDNDFAAAYRHAGA
jgi:ectoine hydroxylase